MLRTSPEREIEAVWAGQRMTAGRELIDAVIREASGTAPNRDVTILDWNASGFVGASKTTEEKHRGKAKRNRNDGLREVLFVAILMQRQPRAGLVSVNETDIGIEINESGILGSSPGQRKK